MSTMLRRRKCDWPTICVAVAIYGGWFLLTAHHSAVPWPLLVALGGAIIAWHGSLQHEVIHGHPTGFRWVNDAMGSVPLGLWLPFAIYRRTHLAHHDSSAITDPDHDPESRYIAGTSAFRRTVARIQSTLLGQLVLGPPIVIGVFLGAQLARLRAEPRRCARDWLPHLIGVGLTMAWLHHVNLRLGTYILAFVYPGTALSLLRGYAEHRADLKAPGKAATVESPGLMSLLFLNNNLHPAHHERPALPWYRLPGYHRRHRARFVREGGRVYAGYGELLRRFALRPHHLPLHPAHAQRP